MRTVCMTAYRLNEDDGNRTTVRRNSSGPRIRHHEKQSKAVVNIQPISSDLKSDLCTVQCKRSLCSRLGLKQTSILILANYFCKYSSTGIMCNCHNLL